jgi:hypothetical protein
MSGPFFVVSLFAVNSIETKTRRMHIKLLTAAIAISLSGYFTSTHAQELGLSFSYFIPAEGYFSVPVSPFSIRGIGYDFNRFISIETGGSLYRMSGMNVRNMPFESTKAIVGPFFSILVPVEWVIALNPGNPQFKIVGGGFAFYNFATRINEGNLDRVLRDHTGWQLVNSDYNVDNRPGIGYHFGGEVLFTFSERFGLSLEAYYLNGSSWLNMRGAYSGLPPDGASMVTVNEDFGDAELDYRGYELSIGVVFAP